MLTNYNYSWSEAVPADYCDVIIKSIDWNKAETAKIGGSLEKVGDENKEYRNTELVWVDQFSPVGCILRSFIELVNQIAGWDYDFHGMENIQIGKYQKSGHYSWHRDTANPMNGCQRKLSIVLLLNDPSEFEGGKLEFRDVPAPDLKKGSIVVFPSFLEHRVTPVISGVRYTAVSWAVGPTFK